MVVLWTNCTWYGSIKFSIKNFQLVFIFPKSRVVTYFNFVKSISSNVDNLEPEDLVKYGLIPEFVGRLPVISNLHELDEHALVRILKEPKNALVNQYKHLFEIDDVELTFRNEALIEIAKQAIKRKTGARGLRSIMEEILMETMFGLPDADLEKVIIDENTVISKSDPIKLLKTKVKKSSVS